MTELPIDQILSDLEGLNCPDDTKKKLLDGAITCVTRWGIEKTTLNDIAREAGCARQTVYNYYKNRDAVIIAALVEAAGEFSKKLIAHIEKFKTPGDRAVEAMMFTLNQLPNEPYLQLITDPKLAPLFNSKMFYSELCLGTITKTASYCVKDVPELVEQSSEIGEVMTRFFLSLILIKSPKNDEEMRAFLRRRLLPGLGIKE
jgi:AcrR family transcriptional regulator